MGTEVTMATIITDVGSIVTASATWVSSAVNTIMSTPILEFFVLSGFVGIGIGLFKRLTRI